MPRGDPELESRINHDFFGFWGENFVGAKREQAKVSSAVGGGAFSI